MGHAQAKRTTEVPVNAPIGGLNTVSAGLNLPEGDCLLSWNLNAAEYGLRSRLGWREWVTGLDGEVRSLMGLTGSSADGSTSRLFAATSTGIWNVTSSTAAPTQDVAYGTQDANSGVAEHSAFTASDGAHWLLVCDESNGYYTYKEATSTWAKVTMGVGATQINGVDPAKFVQVVVHQHRCWFVEKDTQRAWYTDLNSLYGTVTAFNFGAQFKAGGDLRCLATWSSDGGGGPSARLIAVSGGGDVVVYEGTDPTSADTWRIVGQWNMGSVPAGRRLTSNVGGDVAILTSIGILPVSKLSIGNPVIERDAYSTFKIGNLFNQLQAQTSSVRGWCMRLHPQDATLMVLIPTAAGAESEQLVMSLNTRGWSRYRGMPVGQCAEPWGGSLYFGTPDGRVCVNDGYVDGVTLADPNAYTPIDCVLLTAYTQLGSSNYKQVQFVRCKVEGQGGAMEMNAQARYSLDFTEPTPPIGLPTSTGGGTWDVALWDGTTWGGSYSPLNQIFGAFGIGIEVAIGFYMRVLSRTVLVGFDVSYDTGGPL